MWAIEQVDVHILGSSPRASDARILISFIVNAGIVVGMFLLFIFNKNMPESGLVFGVVLAWFASHNFMF